MKDFLNKPIEDLLKGKSTEQATDIKDEVVRQMYLKEVEDLKDFSRDEDHMRWPNPVRPRWKN